MVTLARLCILAGCVALALSAAVADFDAASLSSARTAGKTLVKFYAPWWCAYTESARSLIVSAAVTARTWLPPTTPSPLSSMERASP